jgi:hypothetical protein
MLGCKISRNSEGEMTNGERLTKFLKLRKSGIVQLVMGSLSKHVGKGLCARPFDKLRVTGRFRMNLC